MSGGGTVEERLARALGCDADVVRYALRAERLALYDPATHELVRLGKVRSAVLCIAEALTEGRDVESALAVGERVLRGGSDGG